MEQSKVLIVSDDREFVASLVQSWQSLGDPPQFVVLDKPETAGASGISVAMTDDLQVAITLASRVALSVAVTEKEFDPRCGVVQVFRRAGWAEFVVTLVREVMLRVRVQQDLANAEQKLRETERFAALGRFLDDSRHSLGNALTSVLGNSELLLQEVDSGLRDDVREQIETIHAMSLRIYETFQQLSTLDMELQVAEREMSTAGQNNSEAMVSGIRGASC